MTAATQTTGTTEPGQAPTAAPCPGWCRHEPGHGVLDRLTGDLYRDHRSTPLVLGAQLLELRQHDVVLGDGTVRAPSAWIAAVERPAGAR